MFLGCSLTNIIQKKDKKSKSIFIQFQLIHLFPVIYQECIKNVWLIILRFWPFKFTLNRQSTLNLCLLKEYNSLRALFEIKISCICN